ncbi:acyl-CoA thioesterase [Nesterenkonia aurantiaca]|uniref:acyl-CoA thioesterase n=1 Tax=Nesterenkonia aurantiaca TaxID=1436010 RepID=UPI003EE7935A
MSAVHHVVLPVRWSDQDLNGHVNNARVVTLIEEARISAITSWLGEDGIPDPARPRVVVSLTVDYLRPLDHGPELTARVWVAALGRSSYTVDYELVQYDEIAVRARTVLVQTDPASGRSAPLTERLSRTLTQILTPESKPVPPGAEPGASTEPQ